MYTYLHKTLVFKSNGENNDICYNMAMALHTSPSSLLYLSDTEIASRLNYSFIEERCKVALMDYIYTHNPNRPSTGMRRAEFAPVLWSETNDYKLIYNYVQRAFKFQDNEKDNNQCYDIAMALYTSPTNLLYLTDTEIASRLYRGYVHDEYKDVLMAYIRMKNPTRPPTGFKNRPRTVDGCSNGVLAQYWVGAEPLN
jgi:hypothetical protein